MRPALVGLLALGANLFGATAQFSIAIPQPLRVRTPFNVHISSASTPAPFGGSFSFTLNGNPFVPVGGSPNGNIYSFLCQNPGVLQFGLHYSGDANYEPSSAYVAFEVLPKIATSVTMPTANPPNPGASQPFTLTTIASAEEGFPQSSTVAFYNGATLLAGAISDGAKTFTATVQLPVGTHSITAHFMALGEYESSISPPLVLNVARSQTTLTAPAITGIPRWGEPVTFATTVTPSTAGPIRFFDGATELGAGLPSVTGAATFTTSSLALGPHDITARYAGNANHEPSSSPVSKVTVKARIEIALIADRNPSPDAPVAFSIAIRDPMPNSPPRTGDIVLREGDTTLGTLPLTISLPIGEHTLTAVYAGDALYEPATSPPLIQRVTGSAPTSTTIDVILGDTATLRGRVSSLTDPTPTGTLRIGETTLALANGTAALSDAKALLGRRVTAVYSGDAAHASSEATSLVLAPLNGFSFAFASLAPSQIVTVFGDSLDGASASMADQPAHLYFASANQATFAMPDSIPEGPVTLKIANSQGQTFSATVTMARTAPGIATASADGQGPPAAQLMRLRSGNTRLENLDGPIVFNGDALYLILYGTGFRHASSAVTCSVAGVSVPALYSGAQNDFPGLDQINLALPLALSHAGAVTLSCTADGRTSNAVSLLFP